VHFHPELKDLQAVATTRALLTRSDVEPPRDSLTALSHQSARAPPGPSDFAVPEHAFYMLLDYNVVRVEWLGTEPYELTD
jgi:hypothetical protein